MLSNFEMGPPYSLLNQSICIKVHSCGCLVQNKNLCFPQESPGGNILDVLSQGNGFFSRSQRGIFVMPRAPGEKKIALGKTKNSTW